MSIPKICVVILTYNEEEHIARAINTVKHIAEDILVVDSYSSDKTVDLALSNGAKVIQNKFINHSNQFNWSLQYIKPEIEWILRLDADEIITAKLKSELLENLSDIPNDISGISLRRRILFMGKEIKWGGIFPIQVVRMFRYGKGKSEDRLMDEHINVDGKIISNFYGEIHDINLHPLSRWIEKHNKYSNLEALEVLKKELNSVKTESNLKLHSSAKIKRIIKEKIYLNLPAQLRPFLYFIYRFIFRLGFFDGKLGIAFHFLQGYWYRYLVELKVTELRKAMAEKNLSLKKAALVTLNIEIDSESKIIQ